jgi:hypothetical protein
MKNVKQLLHFSIAVIFILLTSCGKNSETARLVITLVDEEADYKEVNVDIQGISVHTNGDAEETDDGWVDLEGSNVGKKNLLEFTGGTELTLVDTDFPAGKISQIRLKLGPKNTVINDEEHPLKTPSGQQSGLKLQVHENLEAGVTYKFILDFDAGQSVIHNGADDYILKPVIRVITEAVSGAIKGTVEPDDQHVLISVTNGVDVVATTYAASDKSEFILSGIPEGSYSVVFEPSGPKEGSDDPVYLAKTVVSVEVKTGEVTVMDPEQLLVKE